MDSINIDASNEVTKELNKLLKMTKKHKNTKEPIYESDSSIDSESIQERKPKKKDKLTIHDLSLALADLKTDIVKILESVDTLNDELENLKNNQQEFKEYIDKNKSGGNQIKTKNDLNKYQEQIDKILSFKFAEFSRKIDMKINAKLSVSSYSSQQNRGNNKQNNSTNISRSTIRKR